MSDWAEAPYRMIEFRAPGAVITRGEAGVVYLQDRDNLSGLDVFLPEMLHRRGLQDAEAVFLAEKVGGAWVEHRFGAFSALVDALAQGLLDQGFGRGERIAILARNSVAHAAIMFAAMAIGVVVVPLSPSALLRPGGAGEIFELLRRVQPRACVMDEDIADALTDQIDRPILRCSLSALSQIARRPTETVDEMRRGLRGSDWAKLLFTSGSTGRPKAVIHTHAMLAAAQAASAQVFITPDRSESLDWLPWHHTFGGNVNLNAALWRGDALRIDAGLPAPGLFQTTLNNLAEVSPTFFTSVPVAFQMLVDRLEQDPALAAKFFARLRALSAGGAALPPSLIDRLQRAAVAACGWRIPFGAGYGMTETTGVITLTYWLNEHPDAVGLPPPGIRLKLVPIDEERFETRVKGPNVTPGYLDDPDATQAAFDEEGFFRTGDALAWIDPERPDLGLRFAGRLAEDFKLSSGTFVRAGRLRTELIDAMTPLVKDVLIVGEGQDEVGALLVLSAHAEKMPEPERSALIDALMIAFNSNRDGATRRIGRFAEFASPPRVDRGELADKGSLNVVVSRGMRRTEIDALYASSSSEAAR